MKYKVEQHQQIDVKKLFSVKDVHSRTPLKTQFRMTDEKPEPGETSMLKSTKILTHNLYLAVRSPHACEAIQKVEHECCDASLWRLVSCLA